MKLPVRVLVAQNAAKPLAPLACSFLMLWLTRPPNFMSWLPNVFEKSSFQMKRSSWLAHGAPGRSAGHPPPPQSVGRPTPPGFGKTVGNFEAISALSACPAAFVVAVMSLPARENWNSLTEVLERVLVSLAAKLWLGWSQSVLRVGKPVSPQKLPAAFW